MYGTLSAVPYRSIESSGNTPKTTRPQLGHEQTKPLLSRTRLPAVRRAVTPNTEIPKPNTLASAFQLCCCLYTCRQQPKLLPPAHASSGGTVSVKAATERRSGRTTPTLHTALPTSLPEEILCQECESSTCVVDAAANNPHASTPEPLKTTKKTSKLGFQSKCRAYRSAAHSKNMTPWSKTE